jgi:S1-C subfamily serine protease
VRRTASGFGPSDHASFYTAKIPVLFFLGGFHSDIHSPRDTVDKLNMAGAVKIVNLVDGITQQLLTDPARMTYVAPKPGQEGLAAFRRSGAFLGIRPDNEAAGKGVKIADLVPDGPAAKADLKAGDVIQKLGPATVANVSELLNLMSKQKPGEKVKVTVTRGEQTLEIEVTLGKQ